MRFILTAIAAMGVLSAFSAADAQRVRGRVLHEAPPRTAIGLVHVSLFTERDSLIGDVRTDSTGIFSLRAPSPGRYKLRARRLGYEVVMSDGFALEQGEVLTFNFLLPSRRIELQPVTITDKREVEKRLRLYGIDPRTFNGARRITREKLDRFDDGFHTLIDVLRMQNIPGLMVQQGNTGEACLYSSRASAGGLGGGCMKVLLDGVPAPNLSDIEPASIELVLVVDALSAGALYGGGTDGDAGGSNAGVILLFSRGNAP
ncbi:MAG: carboxypeptidase regulatory-like domain-containing protein [Anaerolineae bacterium]|nr:carboxypeptidase regulatory-like domain-containing protein [Gemmatimonadaceae bacterium]